MNKMKRQVLIVDDEASNRQLLRNILADRYRLSFATNGQTAIRVALKVKPDIILMDIMMPEMDGYEACRQLKANPKTGAIPLIFISALSDITDENKGFESGCVDYITKPISPSIVRARVATHLSLYDHQRDLEEMVLKRTAELEKSNRAAIYMLGEAGHYNDTDTGVHIWRMAAYAGAIARSAGWHFKKAQLLELAAPMHDTGKIGIPDAILKKPGPLNGEEWKIMKTHTTIGHNILSKSDSPLFQLAAQVAIYHHERWDGTGYPEKRKGDEIPESARIVAIGDVFDALTMKRSYKEAWPVEEALEEIRKDAGTHFDARMVDCFFKIKDEILEIKSHWAAIEASGVDPTLTILPPKPLFFSSP